MHTSLQRRAITTACLALDAADRHWIPVKRSWRLNERHYGALQGKDKKQTLEQYGEEQFMLWRRSFDTPPPPLDDDDEFSQVGDPRYADLGDEMPRTECLKDVIARFLPYWEDAIVPDLHVRARPSWSPRTATACARSSSTSTGSPTRTSPASTSPPACRWSTASTSTRPTVPVASTSTPRQLPAAAAVANQGR